MIPEGLSILNGVPFTAMLNKKQFGHRKNEFLSLIVFCWVSIYNPD